MTHTPDPIAATDAAPAETPKDRRRLPPPGVEFPKTIKSFVKRAGRTTTGQAKAFELYGARYVLPYTGAPLDRVAAYGAEAAGRPLILEIGFGMGDATAHIAGPDAGEELPRLRGARARRGRAAQAHWRTPACTNIRILQHDAVEVIDHMLPLQSLDGVHIFFPDPWHKTKHTSAA